MLLLIGLALFYVQPDCEILTYRNFCSFLLNNIGIINESGIMSFIFFCKLGYDSVMIDAVTQTKLVHHTFAPSLVSLPLALDTPVQKNIFLII